MYKALTERLGHRVSGSSVPVVAGPSEDHRSLFGVNRAGGR